MPLLPARTAAERAAVARAAARLAPLELRPLPLRTARVRLLHTPKLFRLPWLRRFDGYTIWSLILLREPLAATSDDLLAHEMVHVWQGQHGWVRLWLSYLRWGYWDNPHEVEAREAVLRTRCS